MEAPDVIIGLRVPLPQRLRIPGSEIPWHGDVLRPIIDKGADICGTLEGLIRPTKMNI